MCEIIKSQREVAMNKFRLFYCLLSMSFGRIGGSGMECLENTDRAPSCGKKCTYLQVDFHKVNARPQLLMKTSPVRKTHAVSYMYTSLFGV